MNATISHGMLITEQVAAFIERERLLTPGHRVVVAVSGGPDSLCLLDCLHRLGYPILVAHLDHRLRAGSWREAEFVLRQARRRGLPCIVERVRPPGLRQRGHSIEEAARIARYRFLVRTAREWGAAVVAVGHTADDQVETILMHFLRGAGVYGLRGMLPKTSVEAWDEMGQDQGVALRRSSSRLASIFGSLRRASNRASHTPSGVLRDPEGNPEGGTLKGAPRKGDAVADPGRGTRQGIALIRPLLETTRDQTEAHCRAAGLRPRRDPTNQDPTFFRNRLRHRLLPVLAGYNPRIRDVITRTGEVMRREADMLDEMLDAAEAGAMIRTDGRSVRLDRAALLALPPPLQAGLLWRGVLALVPDQRDLGYQAIELARDRLRDRSKGRRTPLPGGVEMVDQGDFVLLLPEGSEPEYPEYPQMKSSDDERLSLPGEIPLQAGWLLSSSGLEQPPSSLRQPKDSAIDPVAWLDAGKLSDQLLVRPTKPGDRMRPLGMHGHRKLGDIFNSLHIPSGARRRWPVALSGDEIVWLAGLMISDDVRVTRRTRNAIQLRLELPEGIALRRPSSRFVALRRASHTPSGVLRDPAGDPERGTPKGAPRKGHPGRGIALRRASSRFAPRRGHRDSHTPSGVLRDPTGEPERGSPERTQL